MTMLAMIHTGSVVIDPLNKLAKELMPGVAVLNLLDDGIIKTIQEEGKITASILRRITKLGLSAAEAGADAVVITCSSISSLAEQVSQFTGLPVFKIDEAMAVKAVTEGTKIGVVATLQTTLDPTCGLIAAKARENQKKIQIIPRLCADAFAKLYEGDPAGHDQLVLAAIQELTTECDVIILAQASMARLQSQFNYAIPVLTSPRIGMEWISRKLA